MSYTKNNCLIFRFTPFIICSYWLNEILPQHMKLNRNKKVENISSVTIPQSLYDPRFV